MDLIVEPDIYSPNIDEIGNYIDKVPSFNLYKNGLRCSCGSRKDKIFNNSSCFSSHMKTKIHKKWLEDLNNNKANFYIENQKLQKIVDSQKIIIAEREKIIQNKEMTIQFLTQQMSNIMNKNIKTCDLLNFD